MPCPWRPLAAAGTDTAGIQNRLGVLFFMLLYLSLMALSSLPVWRDEKLLFMRERASGVYGTGAAYGLPAATSCSSVARWGPRS